MLGAALGRRRCLERPADAQRIRRSVNGRDGSTTTTCGAPTGGRRGLAERGPAAQRLLLRAGAFQQRERAVTSRPSTHPSRPSSRGGMRMLARRRR